MEKLTYQNTEWQNAFEENIKLAYRTFPIKKEHFGAEFTCRVDGFAHTFKIYAISPKGRKWHVWARDMSMGGSEYKFHKDVLKYIGQEAPSELMGDQDYRAIDA